LSGKVDPSTDSQEGDDYVTPKQATSSLKLTVPEKERNSRT
jgi:hypothetical protein